MTLKEMKRACEILEKAGGEESFFEGEHDVIYFPMVDESNLTPEDIEELDKLGVVRDNIDGGFVTFT